jgi:hypothetical protein
LIRCCAHLNQHALRGWQHWMSSDPTPFSRMLASVISSIRSLNGDLFAKLKALLPQGRRALRRRALEPSGFTFQRLAHRTDGTALPCGKIAHAPNKKTVMPFRVIPNLHNCICSACCC